MSSEAYANDFESKLSAPITTTARPVTFSIQDAVPAVLQTGQSFRMRIDGEYFLITAVDGTFKNLTGSNVEGSTASTHANGATVDQVLTRAGLFNSPGPMTTQGDILFLDATLNPARLPLSSDGRVLTSDVASGLPVYRDGNVWTGQAQALIPGLSGSPDIKPASPNALDDEFDAVGLANPPWTQFGTGTFQGGSDFKSHLHITKAGSGGGDLIAGILKTAPLTTFTVTCKLAALNAYVPSYMAGIMVAEIVTPLTAAKLSQTVQVRADQASTFFKFGVTNYTAGGGAASGSSDIPTGHPAPVYLRAKVTMSASVIVSVDYLGSWDGMTFFPLLLASVFLAGKTPFVGPYVNSNEAAGGVASLEACFDWIRFS